jgi:cytochrome bd-type quinol oxidase subunit 2
MKPLKEDLITKSRKVDIKVSETQIKEYVDNNISTYVDGRLKELESKFESKIDTKETKTTEILAVFITLFTFISANITIFTKVDDVKRASFFMLLMTLCSIILLSFTFIIINPQKNNLFQWVGLLFSLALIILILFGVHEYPNLNIKL